jgi:hypothetical protein
MNARANIALMLLAIPAAIALSQRCAEPPDLAALTGRIDQVAQAEREHQGSYDVQGVVFRGCAVAGQELRPALERILAGGNSRGGVGAAARVCLARLGDTAAFASLKSDLDTAGYADAAIQNLLRVGTRMSTAVVIDYMERKQNDPSRIIDLGDSGVDPVFNALTYLSRQIPRGPARPLGFEPLATSIRRWRDWWASDSANGGILAIEARVPNDPVMRCLARKAEWGFSQALGDLSIRDTAKALTGLIREMADDPRLSADARTILAERGDELEFARLVAALGTTQYPDALYRLEYIGDLRSVGAIVRALELGGFRSQRLTPEIFRDEARRFWSAAFYVLASMVKDPPVTAAAHPTRENADRWRDWWLKGQTVDALKPPRRVLVE